MDFKNGIRRKYQSEVNPDFSHSAWHSFQQYRKKKNKRPFLILWMAAGSAVAIALIFFNPPSPREVVQYIPNLITAANTSKIQELEKEPEQVRNLFLTKKSKNDSNSKPGLK